MYYILSDVLTRGYFDLLSASLYIFIYKQTIVLLSFVFIIVLSNKLRWTHSVSTKNSFYLNLYILYAFCPVIFHMYMFHKFVVIMHQQQADLTFGSFLDFPSHTLPYPCKKLYNTDHPLTRESWKSYIMTHVAEEWVTMK